MLSTSPAFTVGNAKTQAIESKHVINRELWVALQFPFGDDVSAYTRCKAACPSFLAIRKQTTRTEEACADIVRGGLVT